MEKPIISVEQVSRRYKDGVGGIKNVSFEIQKGHITSIIGSSGSGKSTLLKCIYGTLPLEEGSIFFKGERVKGPEEQLIPGHAHMRMVAQDFNLNIYANVYDNIGAMLSNRDLKSKHALIERVLAQLHITHLERKRIVELSGGEQQRVAIARALVNNVEILLLDEPFSQIDTLLKAQLRKDLRNIVKEQGINIIFVSHDPTDGLSISDQMIVLADGLVIQEGSPREIYEAPKSAHIAQLIGQANIIDAEKIKSLNIDALESIAIYPDWISIGGDYNSPIFTIMDIVYKGSIEEIVLERNGLILCVTHNQVGKFKIGDQVPITVDRYVNV